MPELPEVETVRRGLAGTLENARIDHVFLKRSDLRFALPERFAERLEGRRIVGLGRRAKYLLADIEGGEVLAIHLGMSGSLRIEAGQESISPGMFAYPRSENRLHDHVRFALATSNDVRAYVVFNDPRRFGYMSLIHRSAIDSHPHFRHLGTEPTGNGLSGAKVAAFFANRTAPLKAVLLDQRVIAGLGNIYACEALWRARLSPRRTARTLVQKDGRATARLERLTIDIRETIADAISAGGSSLRDYRQADGSLGYFQHTFAVYGREGEPCRRESCPGTVQRVVQSGRSTFFCPNCQR